MGKTIAITCIWLASMLLSGCAEHWVTVKTSEGRIVKLPPCKQTIFYSGEALTVGGVEIPLTKGVAKVNGVEWHTDKLQEAAPIIAAMEQSRLNLCQNAIRDIQVLRYEDYRAEDRKLNDAQQKLDQLAFIVASNNPGAVQRWIDAYLEKEPMISEEVVAVPRGAVGMETSAPEAKTSHVPRMMERSTKAIPLQNLLQPE